MRLTPALRALTVLAFAAATLTGCLRLDTSLQVGEDDTVSGSVVLAIDQSQLGQLSGVGTSLTDRVMDRALADLPPGATVETYAEDGYTGRRVRFTDVPIDQFHGPGGMTITHHNGRFEVTADPGATSIKRVTAGLPPVLTAQVSKALGSLDVRYQVTFPGRVLEANGTVAGRTVTWQIDMAHPTVLHAVAQDSPAWPTALIIGAAALLALLVIGGVLVLALRLARRPAPVVASQPPAGPAPADVPGQPSSSAQMWGTEHPETPARAEYSTYPTDQP